MDASVPSVVDLPDGSFELLPDPRPMRQIKRVLAYYAVLSTGFSAALVVWTLTQPRIPWPVRVLPLVVSISLDLLAWYVIRPPILIADAMEIRSVAPLMSRRMPRSDLALVFRGQVLIRSRHSSWEKTYLFVRRDGKIGIQLPAPSFLPEGIGEFAQRLGVPLRGDFTEKVKGPVDLSKM